MISGAPLAKFLNAYGTNLLLLEFVAVMGLSFLAMTLDRIRTLQDLRNSAKENAEREVGE